jgi:NADPH:quinone reductase-like Zn-dependent oxidoreductase
VTYIQETNDGMDPSSSTGHEIIGRVVEVGNAVTTHKVGDLVERLYGRLLPNMFFLQARFRAILRKWCNIYLQQSR